MKGKQRKEKKWWQYLLTIPVLLGIDALALFGAIMLDATIAGDTLGHPAPAVTILAAFVFGILTLVLGLRAIILCLREILRSARARRTDEVEKDDGPF